MITASALAPTALPLSPASAGAAPRDAAPSAAVTAVRATPQWVHYKQDPALSIRRYVGNQRVAGGSYQNDACRAGTPGRLALWVLPC